MGFKESKSMHVDLWLIHEIPMPSTFLLKERSDKEHIPLWIPFNIQVCMFVEVC